MTSKKDLSLSDNFDLHISSVIVIQRFDLAILKKKMVYANLYHLLSRGLPGQKIFVKPNQRFVRCCFFFMPIQGYECRLCRLVG